MATRTVKDRVTPVISTAIYASGDWLHDDMLEFTYSVPQGVRPQSQARIKRIVVIDKDGEAADLDLYVFKYKAAFDTDPAKNGAATVDADDIEDALLSVEQVVGADYIDGGQVEVALHDCDITLDAGTRKFYIAAIVRATPTYTAADDIIIEAEVEWS